MAVININAFVLKDVICEIAGSDYGSAVSSVTITPTTPTVTFTGMKPGAVFSDVGTTVWTVGITYAQDWETPLSLSQKLMDDAGKPVAITFKPRSGTGPSFKATVVLQAGPIGGAQGATATSTVTLTVVGAVTRVASA